MMNYKYQKDRQLRESIMSVWGTQPVLGRQTKFTIHAIYEGSIWIKPTNRLVVKEKKKSIKLTITI